jgi:hypothetical protein
MVIIVVGVVLVLTALAPSLLTPPCDTPMTHPPYADACSQVLTQPQHCFKVLHVEGGVSGVLAGVCVHLQHTVESVGRAGNAAWLA